MSEQETVSATSPVAALTKRFPQLYVAPAPDALDAYKLAAQRGIAPDSKSLAHFVGAEEDELRVVDTPAGPVEVLFFADRRDFETFFQIMLHKCEPVEIPKTIGASTIRGLSDWGKVADACVSFLEGGGKQEDWPAEFMRLATEEKAFRSEIIVISEGSYSNLSADQTPYADNDAEWIRVSREIRLYHECAHVVCRRMMPEDILPVWDEVTADVCGLVSATGAYDAALAMRFLGVGPDGYSSGRLIEYLNDNQRDYIGELAAELWGAAQQIEELSHNADLTQPFDFMLQLKRNPLVQA